MRYIHVFVLTIILCLSTNNAYAAEGVLPWENLFLRLFNAIIFVGIIWYAGGKIIKKFFVDYRANVVRKIDEAETLKADAADRLAEVEYQVRNVEKECLELIEDGRKQAEALKASIIADAELQAKRIIAQAKLAAEQEGKNQRAAIQAHIADHVIASMEKEIDTRLDAKGQLTLLNKYLSKVVFS